MWYTILQFINVVGVVTNACLIAFTSAWGNSYDLVGQLTIVIVFEVTVRLNRVEYLLERFEMLATVGYVT